MNDDARYISNGTSIRARNLNKTFRIIHPKMSTFGITRLANITGLDFLGVPVVQAIRPMSKFLSVSQGKGTSLLAAKVSALMESIELWHAENIKKKDHIKTLAYSHKHPHYIDLTCLQNSKFSVIQDTHMDLSWVDGADLFSEKKVYIPFDMLSFDNSAHFTPQKLLFNTTTNGLASGNTREEALCHALYEVIERYNIRCWKSNKKSCLRLLDNSSITVKYIYSKLDIFEKNQMIVSFYDADVRKLLPTYVCEIKDVGTSIGRQRKSFFGSGCHIDATIALTRAFCEAAQARLTFIAGSRDDIYPAYYKQKRENYGFGSGHTNIVKFNSTDQLLYTNSFTDNVKLILRILSSKGIKNVIYYQYEKHNTIDIAVVYVLIPQFRI